MTFLKKGKPWNFNKSLTICCLFAMISRKDIDLYLVDITVHLDILGYSIVLPIMASLNESLGGDVDDLSLLFSSYAVTQFISRIGFSL